MSATPRPRLPVLCPLVVLATFVLLGGALALTPGCARGPEREALPASDATPDTASEAASERPTLLDDVAGTHFPVTTASARAQRYVDQGLFQAYGFNHEAAERSFREAARLDPGCAMCFWGVALVLGPNINAPMGPDAARAAWAALQEAEARLDGATARERAYVEALAARYAAEPQADRTALDRAYAEAMGGVHRAHPDDVHAAVLYAEALMDTMPWDYWVDAETPREDTTEVLALLEGVLERDRDHVGANHYLIHTVEKHYPERAVPAAERLSELDPEAGHLVHMPSHIYWRVGRYEDALEVNRRAAAEDEAFFATCRAGPFYRAAYYPHNLHFLWAAAAAEGRADLALSTARRLEAAVEPELEAFPFVEEFLSIPPLTLARFGRWDAILGSAPPDPEHTYLVGIDHYVRGLARVRTGRPEEAARDLDALRGVAAREAAQGLILAGATASAAELLAIGEAHLEGELLAARGETPDAIAALERGVARQDALVYMEPPPWYFPLRQALGAVLLDAEQPAEAERVYREDLAQHPSNGWSLHGLAASLRAQDKEAEADWAAQGFQRAWANADVVLESSRF